MFLSIVPIHLSDIIYAKNPFYSASISKLGDIAVGFYLDKTEKKERLESISCGGYEMTKQVRIEPGHFSYCVNGTHVLPIVGSGCSYVYIHEADLNYDGLHIIYADIAPAERERFVKGTNVLHYDNCYLIVRGGNFHCMKDGMTNIHNISDINACDLNMVPNMITLQKHMESFSSRKRKKIYEE